MVKVTLPGGVQVELPKPQAEAVLAARLAGQAKDPLVDQAIAQIGGRLN